MNESTIFQGITVYISGDPDKKVFFVNYDIGLFFLYYAYQLKIL